MSKAPSMPMYWDAYLADTTHLSCEEHGAYLLLLAAMWRRNGSVPDDDKDNARILGLTVGKWRKIKARLQNTATKIIVENGTITQEKLQKTWQKTQEKIEVNKSNGAKGGRPKSSKSNDLAKANGSDSLKPIETIPEPYQKVKNERPTVTLKKIEDIHENQSFELVENNTPILSKKKELEAEFETVWTHYPRKIGKALAKKAWIKARASNTYADIAKPMADYCRSRAGQDQQFTPHLATWLNASRWEDDITSEKQPINGNSRATPSQRNAAITDAAATGAIKGAF